MSHPNPHSFSGLETRGDVPADRGALAGAPLSPVAALPDSTFSGQSTHSGSTSFSDLQAAADDLDDVEFEFVELSRLYELQDELGQGGMGVVYRALDLQLQRQVAFKRLKPELVANRRALARFQSEARSVAALSHENIVRIYRLGRDAIGPFLVLELVEGESLATRLIRGKLDLDEAIRMFIALAGGISLTHRHGIIHRDIKPGNILLTPEGVPKLSDFGIARQSNDSGLTSTAAAMGTLYYMAPEQHRDSHAVTEPSDLYSLAATFYHAVTGEPPQVIREQRLPEAVRDLTLKALEHDPVHRHQSVAEFAADLRAAQMQLAAPMMTAATDATIQEGECSACHVINPTDRKYCKGCGESLTEACPQCERPSPVWERFCADCGTDIPAYWGAIEEELAEKAQQIEELSREQRYAEALALVSPIESLSAPRWQKWKAWTTDTAATLLASLTEQQQASDTLLAEAQSAFEVARYPQVISLLDQIHADQSTPEIESLRSEAIARNEERDRLIREIKQAVKSHQLEGLQQKTRRLMELHPDRADVRKLHSQLEEREARKEWEERSAARRKLEEQVALPIVERLPPGSGRRLADVVEAEANRQKPPGSMLQFSGLAVGALALVIGLSLSGVFSWPFPDDSSERTTTSPLAASRDQAAAIPVPPPAVADMPEVQAKPGNSLRSDSRVDDAKPAATTSGLGTGTKAGDRRIVTMEGVDFTFRYCPPGTFQMGSPANETGSQSDETQVEATLTQGFWMLETEVTQAMYIAVQKDRPWQVKVDVKEGGNYPAIYVNWNGARDFCERLTAAGRREGVLTTKQQITLPTDACWEYACRAGTTTAYSFGDNESGLGQSGWFVGNTLTERYAHQVGQKQPNLWGLLDMHGNVREWCQDGYDATLPGRRDPVRVTSGSSRVLRGGSWRNDAFNARCSYRYDVYDPEYRGDEIGFRVVVESDTKPIATTLGLVSGTKVGDGQSDKRGDAIPAATTVSLGTGTKAGDRRIVTMEGVDYAFRWCPSGTFKMGSPANETGHETDENQVEVTLTQGFWMLETEVTQAMYIAVQKYRPWQGKADVEEGANYPAIDVTWNDAGDFCEKLTATGRREGVLTTKQQIALPTEARWEYACRAGTTTAYSFGDNESGLGQSGWFAGNTSAKQYAHQVGQKQPNPWGLLDMHGNVWEWCQDAYAQEPSGGRDPVSTSGDSRVLRGGAWFNDAIYARCSIRLDCDPAGRDYSFGFRVIVSQLPSPKPDPQQPVNTISQGDSVLPSTVDPLPASLPKLLTSQSTGMKLRLIPSGTFTMGSPASETGRGPDEGPQHTVRITQPFYMGVYEVTQGEYESVAGTNPSSFSTTGFSSSDVSGMDTSKFPVEQVSWDDAQKFCRKLSLQDGQTYRLPTEAEWEYACRANTTTPFHFGSTLNGDKANVDGTEPYGTKTRGEYLRRTATVGSYGANSFGLYDMHGNVWEWCEDTYYKSAYSNRSGTTSDPKVTSGSDYRVLRGGSWNFISRPARSALRFRDLPHIGANVCGHGFRVVLSVSAVRTP